MKPKLFAGLTTASTSRSRIEPRWIEMLGSEPHSACHASPSVASVAASTRRMRAIVGPSRGSVRRSHAPGKRKAGSWNVIAPAQSPPDQSFRGFSMRAIGRAIVSVLLVLLSAASLAAAQAKAPLSAEKMWTLKRLGDPAISPDGALAVIPVTHYDVKENKGCTDLWIVPVSGGEPRQLTSDSASDTSPVFSPDGRWIAFVSKRGTDEQNQIYVIAVNGGEARRVTNLPTGAGVPKWFPDSRRL